MNQKAGFKSKLYNGETLWLLGALQRPSSVKRILLKWLFLIRMADGCFCRFDWFANSGK
ncbi:hypothetical protein [Paenibacillus sp. FJAT-27812]|uniref:hypothetical protein n=1 Tax=Paenibacillus sp. FJAT-27812 TaxID=1684143 RepID=UPI0012F89BF0|nr:hypothetical protein [Paenibacillus sp. FJAT-27812]